MSSTPVRNPAQFGHFQFWAPTHFLEVICPRYDLSLIVASLSLFSSYQFGRCSSELFQLVPLPHSCASSTCYFNSLHDFSPSLTIPRCHKNVSVNGFFRFTAILRNSLPLQCFPVTYEQNDLNPRVGFLGVHFAVGAGVKLSPVSKTCSNYARNLKSHL